MPDRCFLSHRRAYMQHEINCSQLLQGELAAVAMPGDCSSCRWLAEFPIPILQENSSVHNGQLHTINCTSRNFLTPFQEHLPCQLMCLVTAHVLAWRESCTTATHNHHSSLRTASVCSPVCARTLVSMLGVHVSACARGCVCACACMRNTCRQHVPAQARHGT